MNAKVNIKFYCKFPEVFVVNQHQSAAEQKMQKTKERKYLPIKGIPKETILFLSSILENLFASNTRNAATFTASRRCCWFIEGEMNYFKIILYQKMGREVLSSASNFKY